MERFVPNIVTFRTALRFIKSWAKCRNIYSYKLGFLDDSSLSILVARVCQGHPNASPANIVDIFFAIFSTWDWSLSVVLKFPEQEQLNFAWNPIINPNDHLHKMKIISPMFPHMNTAYNVTGSTLQILINEFRRGHEITVDIFENKASWKNLLKPVNFLKKYRHFIVLTASATTTAHQQEWASFVESKLRYLVCYLERNTNISLAHPYVGSFSGTDGLSTKWIIGFALRQYCPKHLDLEPEMRYFQHLVYSHSRCVFKDGMTISADYSKRKSLKEYIPIQNISVVRTKEPRCQLSPATKGPQEPNPVPNKTKQSGRPVELSDDDPPPVEYMTGRNIVLKLLDRS